MRRAPMALMVLTVAAVSGCRLVAGIEDIQLTGNDGGGGTDGGLPKPEILTSAPGEPVTGLLVDGNFVFARTETSIWRCPLAGCTAPEVIVPSATPVIHDFAIVGGEVYYSTTEGNGTIRAVGLDGKNGRVYRAVAEVYDLATDGTQIFWSISPQVTAGGSVQRCAVPTCTAPATVMTVDYGSATATELHVFSGNIHTVALATAGVEEPMFKCALAGSCGATPQTFIADATGMTFSPSATRLFYASDKSYGFFDATGKKTILGNGETSQAGNWVAGDDAFVYANVYQSASATDEYIMRAPVAGGAAVPIAAAKTFDAGVVSGGYLYFAYVGGAVTLARLKP